MSRNTILLALSLALTMSLGAVGLVPVSSAAAITAIAPTTTCSNGVDNTPGLGLICQVTVVNTITPTGGSAAVTVLECHGAAGDPRAACSTKTLVLPKPVTAVTQCNYSINGGGGTLRCSVRVTNNFVGVSPGATPVSVNQCVGSAGGGGITIICDPYPANTTGATITQCNGSANGGGLVAGSTCTATGTKASALSVTINQCNNSANGGGALIICSANMENVVKSAKSFSSSAPAVVTPSAPAVGSSPAPAVGSSPAPAVVTPKAPRKLSSTSTDPNSGGDRGIVLLLGLLAIGTAGTLILVPKRRAL